jgi:hypothetical protein
MTEKLQTALTAVELREAELLAWGAVGAEWQRGELIDVLAKHGDAEMLLAELTGKGMVVKTPSGGFRSRSAETVRLLATLRQAFREERILSGRPLVLDYRFLQRPRRRPKREISPDAFVASLGGAVQAAGERTIRALIPPTASAFQQRSTHQILRALNVSDGSGVVVTAGTGAGKTLAFYLPLLAWLADNVDPAKAETVALALYPRNELLKDQLRSLVKMSLTLATARPNAAPLSIATWFGPTPSSDYYITMGWTEWGERNGGYLCPFLRCPACDEGDLVWPKAALARKDEFLECLACRSEVPGAILRLTRESAQKSPADIMLSTTESVNRQLSSPSALRAFGIANRTLRAVLLDEIHTYEGTTGAQNALLLRRVRHALGHDPVWAGLSATLTDAQGFFARLANLDPSRVQEITPEFDEMEESGAEYLVALRHDPNSSTGPLSASIQTGMALTRCLDALHSNPFNPAIDSGNLAGSRLFAFTDKLDSTNRLYWDLLDAEGWVWPGKPNGSLNPLTLAHLRSPTQERLKTGLQQSASERDPDGQDWWLAEHLGHQVDGDVQKRIGRTSSQDAGVASDADIIVATASLEVGFDDNRVGAVLQHKAPHDVAQFLQRKGRAGRDATTRPWTVVVLSSWGRDRDAWDAYDALFSPVVPARSLPIENLYVLRIQAVYSMLDWLAQKLNYQDTNSWADAAGPAQLLGKTDKAQAAYGARQAKMAALLGKLLRDGNERESLRRHLRRSLALGRDAHADQILEQIFWESPRPLLAAVVPTLRRRLLDQWAGEHPASDDSGVRSRTPLRDFVPGNLFDELMVPDVEFQVPWTRSEMRVEQLPALRAIREFLPGSVSRHFGVIATHKRHWVPLPDAVDENGNRWVDIYSYGGTPLDGAALGDGEVAVYAPTAVTLSAVPPEVADASDMRAEWHVQVSPLGRGADVALAGAVGTLISRLTAHLHVQGGGVRLMRYAHTARGTLRAKGVSTPERIRFGLLDNGTWTPAALGVEIHCDSLIGATTPPEFSEPPGPDERSAWLKHLVATSTAMPENMSSFDRTNLSDVLLTVAATWPGARAGDIDRGDFANALHSTAGLLGMLRTGGSDSLRAWLDDSDILDMLRRALVNAGAAGRSADWLTWLRRRHTLSAANVLLASLTSWGTGIDADELTVALDPEDDGTFYISEQSPGGTGQIETLTRTMAENPDHLGMALQDALRPSDMELMDAELRAFLAITDAEVGAAVQTLAGAWRSGHAHVRQATAALDDALRSVGVEMGHAARTALSTRLVGPGAQPGLVTEVAEWIQRRDETVAAQGFAVDSRSLATLLAHRVEVDSLLKLTGPSPAERVRAISNVLWPWGGSTRAAGSYNPYAPTLEPDLQVVRDHGSTTVRVIEFAVWDEEVRRQVHDELLRGREAVLRTPATGRPAVRSAILDLNTVPSEVGPLLCHPQVTGATDRGEHAELRVLLRESW